MTLSKAAGGNSRGLRIHDELGATRRIGHDLDHGPCGSLSEAPHDLPRGTRDPLLPLWEKVARRAG